LQLFWPLQLFFADLQSEVPLHEFTPLQCMVASSAAKLVVVIAVENSIAAAAAMAALDVLLICMVESSLVFSRSDIAAQYTRPGQHPHYYSKAKAHARFGLRQRDIA
jgi:hypothetical protein